MDTTASPTASPAASARGTGLELTAAELMLIIDALNLLGIELHRQSFIAQDVHDRRAAAMTEHAVDVLLQRVERHGAPS